MPCSSAELQHGCHGVADARDAGVEGRLVGVGGARHVEVDHAAGVDHEVGSPHDPALRETAGDLSRGELVVGGADDGAHAQRVDDLAGEHATQPAGHEHVGLDEVGLVRLHPRGAELVGERALGLRDIRHRESGARRGEAAGEPAAHLAESGDDEVAARDVGRAEDVVERGEDRGVDARRRGIRGLAHAALLGGEAAHVLGALVHDGHELGARADVLRGHVGAAERLDGVAEVEHGVVGRLLVERDARRDADHGLAAAPGEPGRGVLHGHRLREAEGVGEGVGPVSVAPEARAAEGLAEPRRVDGHDDGESGPGASRDEHALVLGSLGGKCCADLGCGGGRGVGDRHRSFSLFIRFVGGTAVGAF